MSIPTPSSLIDPTALAYEIYVSWVEELKSSGADEWPTWDDADPTYRETLVRAISRCVTDVVRDYSEGVQRALGRDTSRKAYATLRQNQSSTKAALCYTCDRQVVELFGDLCPTCEDTYSDR